MGYSKMTDTELSQLIHEKIMGFCWHSFEVDSEIPGWRKGIPQCKKCGNSMGPYDYNPFYSVVWHDYGILLDKLKENDFMAMYEKWKESRTGKCFTFLFMDKRRGCEMIAEYFLKEKS